MTNNVWPVTANFLTSEVNCRSSGFSDILSVEAMGWQFLTTVGVAYSPNLVAQSSATTETLVKEAKQIARTANTLAYHIWDKASSVIQGQRKCLLLLQRHPECFYLREPECKTLQQSIVSSLVTFKERCAGAVKNALRLIENRTLVSLQEEPLTNEELNLTHTCRKFGITYEKISTPVNPRLVEALVTEGNIESQELPSYTLEKSPEHSNGK